MENNIKNQQALFLAIVTLFWFSQYVYIPFQTPYLLELNVASSFIGVIIGSYGVSQLIVRLPMGIVADYINKEKFFIFLGCFLASLASIIRILLPSGNGFFMANLLSGFASGTWISYMVYYTNLHSQDKQQYATSIIIMFNNIGILLAFTVATFLYDYIGMNVLCVFSIICGFCGALLSLFITNPKDKSNSKITIKELITVCFDKRLIFFACLALVQQGFQMSTTMSFSTQILKNLGASSLMIGYSSIIYMISAVIFSKIGSSKRCQSLGAKICIPITFSFMFLYCILVPIVNNIYIIFLLQILPGVATGILFSYITSQAMINVPLEKKSTAMGFFQAIYDIGMTTFPILIGNLAETSSIKHAYFILSIICLFACIISSFYYISSIKSSNKESTVVD